MPEPRNGGVKTLAIRLEGDLHARLSFIAQVEGDSITDAIRKAIESYIQAKHAESDFATRAAAILDALDREAAVRRLQIEEFLGKTEPAKPEGEQPKGHSRRREQQS